MNNLIVETKVLHISTQGSCCSVLNSNTNYKSWCQYSVPKFLQHDDFIEYVYLSIPYAVIPCSFFIVNDTNNTLNVLIGSTTTSYTFTNGNYNASTFISSFISLLGSSWSISLNSINNFFTVTNTTYDFSFLETSTISNIIGFSTTISSTSKSLTMTRCCNFYPLPRVIIRCPELGNCQLVSTFGTTDILASIPNNARPGGQIYYQNQTQIKTIIKNHDISKVTIILCDDNGNLINFNGVSSYLILQFDIFRRYNIIKPPLFNNLVEHINENSLWNEQNNLDEADW